MRYTTDKLIIAKIKKGNSSVITCDRVTVLTLCTSSDGHLSMYQVSLIPFYTFRDMLQTSFLLQKIKKGSNSINTGDRVMDLAFCNFPHGPLSVYQVSLNYLQNF